MCKDYTIWLKALCSTARNVRFDMKNLSCGQIRREGFLCLSHSRFNPEKRDLHKIYFNTYPTIKALLGIITSQCY